MVTGLATVEYSLMRSERIAVGEAVVGEEFGVDAGRERDRESFFPSLHQPHQPKLKGA